MPHRLGALFRTERPALQMLRGGFLVASTAFSFAALERLALPEMTVITFVAPLLAMALAVLWLGERVGARRWAAALVGFAAVAVAAGPDGLTANTGVVLALGMALFYALYQVATRALRHAAPAPTALFYAALAGAAASSAVVPFFWRVPDLAGWGLLALPALFGAVGQYVLIRAYETAPGRPGRAVHVYRVRLVGRARARSVRLLPGRLDPRRCGGHHRKRPLHSSPGAKRAMQFGLTEDQTALKEAAGRFAREVLLPGYRKREDEAEMGAELIREMGRLGLVAPSLPERYGGMGIDGVTAGLLIEEIAYGDLNVSYVPLLSSLSADILARHGDEALAAARLPAIAEGRETIALALTEPRGGSDAANLQLRARRDGDDWVIDGEKASISMAAHADSVLALARTDPDRPGARGVTAFLIDLDAPGVSRSAYDDLGSLAVGRGSIWFDGVRVPDRNRVGPEGAGFTQTMQGFDYSRTMIGLQCLGAARASLDETWPYTLEREAFGRPIAEFQGVTFPLAEYDTQVEGCRLLCYRTLWLRDQGMAHTKEAAMCKWWAPKLAVDTIHQCLLTHGHLGYSKDLPHQQRLRDVMGLEIGDGTAQISKMVIARETVGRAAVQYARR